MARQHKDWIHDFVAKVSPRSEAPERFLYWAAVGTISGAIRRRCYIDMGTFAWYPNWYIILVGPPGLKKSTAIDLATKLLRPVEGVVFGSDCATWQQFVQEVADAVDVFATGGAREDFLEQEYTQTSAITFAISEFGTFFDPKDLTMVNVLTEFWDGKDSPFVKSTKTQGKNVIHSPFVNLIGATTPKWIADNFSSRFGGWGLSSRIIFLYADETTKQIAYPDELWGREKDTWGRSFTEDLAEIAKMEGPFSIDQDVREFARAWYVDHDTRTLALGKNPNSDPWLSYYLQRKWSHIHKLAIVLSVSRGDSYRITMQDIQEAIDKCNAVEDQLGLVFKGQRGETDRRRALISDVGAAVITGLWMSGGRCPATKIYKFTYRAMSGRETDELLSQMVKAGFVEKVQRGAEVWFDLCEEGKTILAPEERSRLENVYGDPLAAREDQLSGLTGDFSTDAA